MDKTFNKYELENFAKIASRVYLENGTDLNETITKLAKENGLNRHHIDRVAQTANTLVNGEIVKQARSENRDPRLRFDLADGEKIAAAVNARVKTAEYAGVEDDLYAVARERDDVAGVVSALFGAPARDPFADHARSVSPADLTAAYVREPETVVKIASRLDSQSLALSHRDLELMTARARNQLATDKVAAEAVYMDMADEIETQILNGESPATIRDVVKRANLDQSMTEFVDTLITRTAAAIGGVREGVSKLAASDVVNTSHPLFAKTAALASVGERVSASAAGVKRLSSACKLAAAHLNAAVGAGR